jgi:release factor glutamine methyltransferase
VIVRPAPVSGRKASGIGDVAIPETSGEAVAFMVAAFREAGLDSPGLDARRLACWASMLDGAALMREPERRIGDTERRRLSEAATRRLGREPVSRIEGFRTFHGLEFELSPATLDPRPDTETLVDGVLELVRSGRAPGGRSPRILDLGTGSGSIIGALLHSLPGAQGMGTDISREALDVAARNAARIGVSERADFRLSRWLDDVRDIFDVVVSNPPYIPTQVIAELEAEVVLFDPVEALDGGEDGLDAYRILAKDAWRAIAPGGWLVMEIGSGQSHDVARLLMDHAPDDRCEMVEFWPDLSGQSRCVAARARQETKVHKGLDLDLPS